MTKNIIIGLVGTSGAGKSTAASYLKAKGYQIITLSSFLKEALIKEKVKKITKRKLQDKGNQLRNDFGPAILAQKAIDKIKKKKIKKGVIDGIRNTEEIKFLKKEKNFFLLGIKAKSSLRFQRAIKSGRKDRKTYQEFLKVEKRDSHLGDKKYGLRVRDCLKKAQWVIVNNLSVEHFYQQIDNIINYKIKK